MNNIPKITGSCKCRAIKFELNETEIKRVVNCHCNLCRKMNGAAFSTYLGVFDAGFKLISGELNIQTYPVSKNASKSFCNICGTPIYNMNPKYQGLKILHLGSLDNPKLYTPKINIYCESQLDWVKEIFNMKNFQEAAN